MSLFQKKEPEPVVYQDMMAQRNGSPVEDIPEGTEWNDPVNHPAHYCDGGIETIDFILAKKLDFLLGQVVKYVSRAGKKDPAKELEDLRKAEFYLRRKIRLMEGVEDDDD